MLIANGIRVDPKFAALNGASGAKTLSVYSKAITVLSAEAGPRDDEIAGRVERHARLALVACCERIDQELVVSGARHCPGRSRERVSLRIVARGDDIAPRA